MVNLFRFVLSSGEVIGGRRHESYTSKGSRQLGGSTLDLKNAFRQFAGRAEHKMFAVIVVWNPLLGRPQLFVADALMFGELGAMVGFCRCGRALQHLLSEIFDITTSNWVDDYPLVEPMQTAHNAAEVVLELCELLGWACKDPLVGAVGQDPQADEAVQGALRGEPIPTVPQSCDD